MSATLISWNVNSLNKRMEQVKGLILHYSPEVLLLQETKLNFNNQAIYVEALADLGYRGEFLSQANGRNGVAIVAKSPLVISSRELTKCGQARYIAAEIELEGEKFTVATIYVPNGQNLFSPNFDYKLEFLEELYTYCCAKAEDKLIIGGDYNVAPFPIDVYSVSALENKICFSVKERAAIYKLLNLGMIDCFRAKSPRGHEMSWWPYTSFKWDASIGMRIDYFLASPHASNFISDCKILSHLRRYDSPSDHAPILLSLE